MFRASIAPIPPVVTELYHADRRTDMAKLRVAFCSLEKEPKDDLFVFIFLFYCEKVKHFRSSFVSDVVRYDCMLKCIFVLSLNFLFVKMGVYWSFYSVVAHEA